MKGFRSQNVPWKGLPPLKSVRHLPRDLIVHMRFVIGKDDGALLRTYYAAEGEERDGNWTFWGVIEGFRAAEGMFLAIGDAEGAPVLWRGASARQGLYEMADGQGVGAGGSAEAAGFLSLQSLENLMLPLAASTRQRIPKGSVAIGKSCPVRTPARTGFPKPEKKSRIRAFTS